LLKIGLVYEDLVVRGGGQRLLLTQAKLLQDGGFDVTVFTPAYSQAVYPNLVKSLKLEAAPAAHSVMLSRLPILSQTLREIETVYRWCPSELAEQDLIIGYTYPSNITAYRAHVKWDVPVIWHCTHPLYWLYPRSEEDRGSTARTRTIQNVLRVPLTHIEKRASRAFSQVVVISTKIGRRVNAIYGLPSTVLSPPVDPAEFRTRVQVAEEPNSILYVGRLLWNKGPDLFLRVLRGVASIIPDAKGIVVVAGQDTRPQSLEAFKQAIFRMGLQSHVELITKMDWEGFNIEQLYRRSALVAYTCRDEDFGLVPLEAALCGRPSVLWDDCGCVEDEILQDEKSALVARHYDVGEYVERVVRALKDPSLRSALSANARISILRHCSPEVHANQLETIIRKSS
jgi:D-inositol-3-phosphate glycosyltransferase